MVGEEKEKKSGKRERGIYLSFAGESIPGA